MLVISAPSGTGKTTLSHRLFKDMPGLVYSVSATTRPPRKGERNGREYFFFTVEEFREKIKKDFFAEWARVYGHYYGTPKKFLSLNLRKGRDVFLDLDVQGALKIKKRYPEATLIFISPPSIARLKERIIRRHQDNRRSIATRLANFAREMDKQKYYDYLIVNDNLSTALEQLKSIIVSEKLKLKH